MNSFESRLNDLTNRVRYLEMKFTQFINNNFSQQSPPLQQQQQPYQLQQQPYQQQPYQLQQQPYQQPPYQLQQQLQQLQQQQQRLIQEKKVVEERGEDINVNVLGFYNILIVNSQEVIVEDEKSTVVSWNEPTTNNGKAFSGLHNENILINLTGKNVMYEFIITVSWKPDINGFRTISLEDSTGKIISSTFIPDDIDIDINHTHKHQVIFKQEATKKGGWKIKLYQNSGETLIANVNVKIIGPFIF